jgi:hypothetical protein
VPLITSWQLTLFIFAALGISTVWFMAPIVSGVWRFLFRRGIEPAKDWLDTFSFERYKGLTRLFDPQDFEFLKRQPGYAPELLARLKADRLSIAEGYLRQLETDVRLLLNFANRESGKADADHQDFSAFLLKQEFGFACKIGIIRAELTLMRLGLLHRIEFQNVLDSVRPLMAHGPSVLISVS